MKGKRLAHLVLLIGTIVLFFSSICSAQFVTNSTQADGELKSSGAQYGQFEQGDKDYNFGVLGGGSRGYEWITSSKSPGKRGARGAVDGEPDAGSSKGNTFTTTVLDDNMKIGQTLDGNYQIFKSYLSFNTSAIHPDAVISGAKLILYGKEAHNDTVTTYDIEVRKSAYTDPLWNPDWGAVSGELGKKAVSNFIYYDGDDYATGKNEIEIGVETTLLDGTKLNTQADMLIEQGGITKIVLVSSRAIQEVMPSDNEYIEIFSSDAVDKNLRPQLEIDYDTTYDLDVRPLLTWIPGDTIFKTSGTSDDELSTGTHTVTFKVRYIYDSGDGSKGIAPKTAKLLIDRNGNDSFNDADDLSQDLTASDPTDDDYSDGKDYETTVELTTNGDNDLGYKFLFVADDDSEAEGDPAGKNLITAIQDSDSSDDSGKCFISTLLH